MARPPTAPAADGSWGAGAGAGAGADADAGADAGADAVAGAVADAVAGEARPRASTRAWLGAGVLAAWALALLPTALGWQTCPFARVTHRPCPGCGMTRAIRLLLAGHMRASLHMHPLAVPVFAVGVGLVVTTFWTTLQRGSPASFYRSRTGRAVIALGMAVYAGALVLWIARWFGALGGPVPVS